MGMAPMNLIMFLILVSITEANQRGCDRGRSRLVRKIVYEKLMPAFTSLGADLSDECPFSPAHDRYRTQETHKSLEEGSKWYCHFCGKAFVSEYFLDFHFDNRHADYIEEKSICLADACEVFRCDVVSRKIVPDYWDVALCLEDDMKNLHQRCEDMVKLCVPSGFTENQTQTLIKVTTQELCTYLTCSKYWEVLFSESSTDGLLGVYIVLTLFILCGVVIYYCLFFTYFYTDTFADTVTYDPTTKSRHPIKPYQPDLRQRPRSVPLNPVYPD